jgi:hypothetical protein
LRRAARGGLSRGAAGQVFAAKAKLNRLRAAAAQQARVASMVGRSLASHARFAPSSLRFTPDLQRGSIARCRKRLRARTQSDDPDEHLLQEQEARGMAEAGAAAAKARADAAARAVAAARAKLAGLRGEEEDDDLSPWAREEDEEEEKVGFGRIVAFDPQRLHLCGNLV